jgi:hypothetical protein
MIWPMQLKLPKTRETKEGEGEMKITLRKGDKVQVRAGDSAFDGKKGIVVGKSDLPRFFMVHLTSQSEDIEFHEEELFKIGGRNEND